MSVQTHTPSVPPAPAGMRGIKRLRWFFSRQLSNPNPVWIRELKQSARLQRTPIILAVLTGMVALLIASIGGVWSTTAAPAQVGVVVYHVFFSLSFWVVAMLGPAVAAATIASERSGGTWEALLLTGLSPAGIARGKFLASLTYISLYVVMLAPVGGLAFLFGGVTPGEVLLAFALLLVIAGLSVAFGLAVSSKFQSPVVAIVVTLPVTFTVTLLVFGLGGFGLGYAAHAEWPGVASGGPAWLPTAYIRAEFGLPYLAFLVLAPAVTVSVPGWLFYEVTIANMASPSDDRSTRLRLWTLVSAPALAIATMLTGLALDSFEWFIVGGALIWAFFVFSSFLIAGEPLYPSARVKARWQKARAGRILRFFGPGVARAGGLSVALALLCLAGVVASVLPIKKSPNELFAVASFAGYAFGFSSFLLGFSVWSRSVSAGATGPRLLLLAVLFLATLGPYIAMAIAGILTDSGASVQLLSAPSPAFAFVAVDRVRSAGTDVDLYLSANGAAALGWGLIGVGLWVSGWARARRAELKESRARASAA